MCDMLEKEIAKVETFARRNVLLSPDCRGRRSMRTHLDDSDLIMDSDVTAHSYSHHAFYQFVIDWSRVTTWHDSKADTIHFQPRVIAINHFQL